MNAAAQAKAAAPPTPDECSHPAPVTGVMAHEFAHYAGAQGPEGKRRTVTFYGPVVGGLPIDAWHCENCGLLKLDYPDGRHDERRLYPGPQPGLLAKPSAVDPNQKARGRQYRTSGLSISPALEPLLEERGAPVQWHVPSLPRWSAIDWLSVIGLIGVAIGLLVASLTATLGYSVPDFEPQLVLWIAVAFFAVIALQICGAVYRHYIASDQLAPSVAVASRGTPALDSVTKTIVTLMVITAIALFIAAILATYDYQTSPLEGAIVVVGLISFALALVIGIWSAAARHFSRS